MENHKKNRIFRVLTLDGGGMRGIYTAAYLSALSTRYERTRQLQSKLDIGKGFELITGTSTGGIIACALANGVPLEKMITLYRDHGSEIFPLKLPSKMGLNFMSQLWRRSRSLQKGDAALKQVLDSEFGKATLAEVWKKRGIALAIPAVEMSRYHAWVFKTPHLSTTRHRDDDYSLVDVCMATSGAPIYRSMAYIDNPDTAGHHVFVDGGLWANNPVLVGLIDALAMTQPGDRIEIYCLGTCPRPEGEPLSEQDVHRGLGDWQCGGKVVSVSIGAQEYAFDNMARMLAMHVDRDCKVVRFPHGKVPAELNQYLDLDETRPKALSALITQANRDVDETLSRCADPNDEMGRMLDTLFNDLPELKGEQA